ncbi:hypothetical protein ARMSODRAFT_1090124 [Armillaria solidipes]|uniref:Ribosomal RNA methyltransferase FtsJ domain-containing protein n=1 Tax=Armillaria solidipes TaxID=1076256 RepID=A0A2H3ATB8_9AGAR|nr:hypothetical protein ARMSODRAFT_1090124 [Armillaria solidipes]
MSFRPTLAVLSKESSTQWIARQYHDHDVKQRVSPYKSRNAFNLLEVDSQLSFPDLGVAPGGWSEPYRSIRGTGPMRTASHYRLPFPGDYDPLSIDNINMKDRSESKGRGTVVAVDLQVKA